MTKELATHLQLPDLAPLLETKNATLHYCVQPPTLVSSSVRPPDLTDATLAKRAKALTVPPHPAVLPVVRTTTLPEKNIFALVLNPPCPRLTRLTSHLRARGSFGHEKATLLTERLLGALHEMRDCGLLHTSLSVDHILLDNAGDLYLVPTLHHGSEHARDGDAAVSRAAAHCIFVFYTGFVRRASTSHQTRDSSVDYIFPDHISDSVKRIVNRLHTGENIVHVLQDPLFLETAEKEHGSPSMESVASHSPENGPIAAPETSSVDRASRSHCSASSDRMSAVTAPETVSPSEDRNVDKTSENPKPTVSASSASSTSSCSADEAQPSSCDPSSAHFPVNTSVVSTASASSAASSSFKATVTPPGQSRPNGRHSPAKLNPSKKARTNSAMGTSSPPPAPSSSRTRVIHNGLRNDRTISASSPVSPAHRVIAQPKSPSLDLTHRTAVASTHFQASSQVSESPASLVYSSAPAYSGQSRRETPAPEKSAVSQAKSPFPPRENPPHADVSRPYGAARLMTPNFNRSTGPWRGRLDSRTHEACPANASTTSVPEAAVSGRSTPLRVPSPGTLAGSESTSPSKQAAGSAGSSRDGRQESAQSLMKHHMLAATAAARPDGAAKLMNPNAHRPLGPWRGRVADIGAANDKVRSASSDVESVGNAAQASTPDAPLPPSPRDLLKQDIDTNSDSGRSSNKTPAYALDEKMLQLLQSLKDPILGVQLEPYKKGALFRRSPAGMCFTGSAACVWIAAYMRTSRKEACEVAQKLLIARSIRSVVGHAAGSRSHDPVRFRDSSSDHYVFVEDRAPSTSIPSRDLSDSASSENLSVQSSSQSCSSGNQKDRPVVRETRLIAGRAFRSDLKPSSSGPIGTKPRTGYVARTEMKQAVRSSGSDDQPMSLSNLAAMLLPSSSSGGTSSNGPGTVLNGKPSSWDGPACARDPITVTGALLSELRDICEHFALAASSPSVSSSSSSEPSNSHLPSASDALFSMDPCDDMLMDSAINCSVPIASTVAKRGQELQNLGIESLHVEPAVSVPCVNIECLQASPEFARFERATAELQAVDLDLLTTRSAKAAFAINLYNLLSLHARISVGSPSNRIEKNRVHHRIVYRVGGEVYFSLDDILNVILRSEHRRGISKLIQRQPRNGDTDWHRRLAVQPVMPEALCAILTTWSSYDPPVRVYTSDNLSVQLSEVIDRFLSTWVRPRLLPSKAGVARVPRIFTLFVNDFVSDRHVPNGKASTEHAMNQVVLAWISEHIRSNAGLADRVSQCQHLEYYRLGDAFDANSSSTFAPYFWDN